MEIGPTLLKIMLNSFSYVLCVLGPTFLKNLHLGLSTEVASSRFGSVVYVFSRHKPVVINGSFTLFEHERMRLTPVSFYLVLVQGFTCQKVFALSYQEYPTEPLDKTPARQGEFELAGKKNIG